MKARKHTKQCRRMVIIAMMAFAVLMLPRAGAEDQKKVSKGEAPPATKSIFGVSTMAMFYGKVYDRQTGVPLAVKYQINAPGGSVIRGKTSAVDGRFQQVLRPDVAYTITFYGNDIFQAEEQFEIAAVGGYQEVERSFELRSIRRGDELAVIPAFDVDDNSVSDAARDALMEVADLLMTNRHIQVVCKVPSDDIDAELLRDRISHMQAFFDRIAPCLNARVTVVARRMPVDNDTVVVEVGKHVADL